MSFLSSILAALGRFLTGKRELTPFECWLRDRCEIQRPRRSGYPSGAEIWRTRLSVLHADYRAYLEGRGETLNPIRRAFSDQLRDHGFFCCGKDSSGHLLIGRLRLERAQ